MEVNAVRISKPVRGVQRPQPTAVRGSSCRHVFCGPGRAVQPRCAARCPNPHRCHAGWPAWVLATGPYPSPCYKHSPSWHASNGHGRPPTHRGCLGGLDNCDLNSNTKDLHPAEARFLCNQRSANRCCKGLGCCDSRFLLRCCKECGSPHDALWGSALPTTSNQCSGGMLLQACLAKGNAWLRLGIWCWESSRNM
jgi:hypothetical protein